MVSSVPASLSRDVAHRLATHFFEAGMIAGGLSVHGERAAAEDIRDAMREIPSPADALDDPCIRMLFDLWWSEQQRGGA